MAAGECSPATIEQRTYQLRRIARDLGGCPGEVTTGDLIGWLREREHWSANTRRSHRGALRAFYAWATAAGVVETSPAAAPGHLTPAHLGKLVAAALPEGYTMHSLRHRCGTVAYAATRDLRAVQELLGHARPETTAIYTAVPDGAIRAAVEAAA